VNESKKICRILHVVGMMDRGGSETMLMNIFRHINRDKFKFFFLTHLPDTGAYDKEIKQLGGTLFFIPSLGTLGYARYITTLYRFIREKGPFDIVHSHLDWQGGAIALAARLAGVKNIIVHSHSSSWRKPDTLPYNLLLKFNRFLVAFCASEGWACSQEAGEFLFSKRLFKRGAYRKIRNAIDLDSYKNLTQESALRMRKILGIPEKTLVLGHVGTFLKSKNQVFLIQIAVQLKKQNWDFRLVLIGDGAMRQEIEDVVVTHGLSEQVMFFGLRDDIPECMNMFDALLFPSLYEGLGIAAIEAQAAGIPCLVSEHIPREVDMGLGLVMHLSLKSVESWIAALHDVRSRRFHLRSQIDEQITTKGYNIRESVNEITSLYELICTN
jgi:glycosyltransferase EpsF